MPKVVPHPSHYGYGVSDDGRVWSRHKSGPGLRLRDDWHQLLPDTSDPRGYQRVKIGRRKQMVHRLVLETFVGPCPPGMETRHIDGDPSNNHLTNLAWGTKPENQRDIDRHGTRNTPLGEQRHNAKLTEEDVRAIRADTRPQADIASDYGVTQSQVSRVRNKRHWAHV